MTHEEENYNGLVDALKVSEDENRKLIEALNKARKERDEARAELAHIKAEYEKTNPSELTRDALVLQNALMGTIIHGLKRERDQLKEKYEAQIVLEQTGKKL